MINYNYAQSVMYQVLPTTGDLIQFKENDITARKVYEGIMDISTDKKNLERYITQCLKNTELCSFK